MKLASYIKDEHEQLGIYHAGKLYAMEYIHPDLPNTMGMFLNYWEDVIGAALRGDAAIKDGALASRGIPAEQVELLAPVPFPSSLRDGYAFKQHVAAARRNRGVPMIPEFDQYPIFYFSNHNAIQGHGQEIECMNDHFEKLDFELEAAMVICKGCKNITAAEADEYIGGLMIFNDMSARRLQMEEMLLNLGPAKGKDFSNILGPWLVTLDELEVFEVPCKDGHTGKAWNLPMTCRVNDTVVSKGNMADMDWTFAEIIERCAYGVQLHPGDVIGSGTAGTGCFLELNGTGKLNNPDYTEQWLQNGDIVTMEIEGLGQLSNKIITAESDFSILDLKKL